MAMPVTRLERRQNPRMTVDGFAYINIEPNNGGSVLNVSDRGLCFHSIAPVPKDRDIHFWFSEQDRRIEGIGEVAWMDDTQKTVGVRFTSLSSEARERINRWTSLAAVPAPTSIIPAFGVNRLLEKPAVPNVPAAVATASASPEKLTPFSGFARGLLTGLLVAIVVAAGFSVHAYRQEFGQWLIRTGQEFASNPQAVTATSQTTASTQQPTPTLQSAVLSAQPSQSSQSQAPQVVPIASAAASSAPASKPDKPLPQAALIEAKPAPSNPAPATQVAAVIVPANNPKPLPRGDVPVTVPNPPALPSSTPTLNSDVIQTKAEIPQLIATSQPPATSPHVEVEASGKASSGPPPEMYFEVGRSKDSAVAREISDKLDQIGFHSSVAQKSRLWSNSYAVLVGPYSDEDAAAEAGKALLAHDFRPRAFERGNRDIELRSGLTLNGEPIPGGDCTISWESYITGTVVKVWQDRSVIVKADGRWRKNETKYKRDAFVYRKNLDGSKTLLEIQFMGLKRALVFGNPS